MKTSNKTLMTFGAIPFLFFLLLALAIRIIPVESLYIKAFQNEFSSGESRMFSLDGFKDISTQGNWLIDLIQGHEYSVEIIAPGDIIDNIIIEKREGVLFLDPRFSSEYSVKNKGSYSSPNYVPAITMNTDKLKIFKARITMPSISQISLEGTSTVRLSGFKIVSSSILKPYLQIISAAESSTNDLIFMGNGTVEMD